VLDLVVVNMGWNNYRGGLSSRWGISDYGGSAHFIGDLHSAYVQGGGHVEWISRILNHEMGHVLGLNHVENCSGEGSCTSGATADINPALECASVCPSEALCFPGINPSQCPSNPNKTICTWSNSNNMMGQGWEQNALTPCQWSYLYNSALPTASNQSSSLNFAKLCPTVRQMTLTNTNSPVWNNDYRASEFIASTAVLQGISRYIDYWSPSIKLNAGFRVDLGTAFRAAPTTFPCCGLPATIAARSPNEAEEHVGKYVDFSITPNPFEEAFLFDATNLVNVAGAIEITFLDTQGRIVKTFTTTSSSARNMNIDTSSWASGVYICQVRANDIVLSKKIIKF
jgi:Secretion system C-terminal sorting domain